MNITERVTNRQPNEGVAGLGVEAWDRPSTLAHQSDVVAGLHQHFFTGATATLTINPEDTSIAYVYLDPSEVMLQWNDGIWKHRAYWGTSNIDSEADRTEGRVFMRTSPSAGKWLQLETRAHQIMPARNDKSDDRRAGAGSKGGVHG